jgi:isopentenyldiphosphate isomerase
MMSDQFARDELLQIVDRDGNPTGSAARSECHGNPELIQAVVHLHLFDRAGRLYLQKRAADKDRYPGRWDASVGGHVAPGESPDQAIRREAHEELGIDLDHPGVAGAGVLHGTGLPNAVQLEPGQATGLRRLERLEPYIYGDEIETEFVVPYRMVFDGSPRPDPVEVEEGGFFQLEDIRRRLQDQPDRFTPHFRQAFGHLERSEQRG